MKSVAVNPDQPDLTKDRESRHGAYPAKLNLQIHGLRGFSALSVFIYHIYGMSTLLHFWPAILEPAGQFFDAGRYGVEIFFMISGYLITASLIRHQSATKFLIDRCIRIYPVFLAIHLIVFSLGPVIGYKWMAGISAVDWLKAFISNFLFLPGMIANLPIAQMNAWSLSYEAAFYLFSAGVFVAASRRRRWFVTVAAATVAAPILFLRPIAAFFAAGVAVFFLVRNGSRLPSAFRALSIPALIATLTLLTLSEHHHALLLTALAPGFICFWSIVDGRCALSAVLRSRLLQYLGTISYSFYLWSPVVTYPTKLTISKVFHGRISDLTMLILFAAIGFATALCVSRFSYSLLEERCGRSLRQWMHQARPQPANSRSSSSTVKIAAN
jgi:peptidoglycan/LPS O-acetylase OafA/YrhL